MKELVRLSVIIPVYNCEKTLDKCILSVIGQTYNNLEILLINDASQDDSFNICNKYKEKDKRIKVINNIVNLGVSETRNIGIAQANGEYVTFVDSDDYLDLNTYKESMDIIDKNKIDILKFSYIKEFGEYKKNRCFKTISGEKIEHKEFINKVYPNFFNSEDYTAVWNSIIKKECIKNVKFNSKLKFAEDFLFMTNVIANAKNLYILDNPFYHYIVNPKSATQKYNFEKTVDRIDNILIANTDVLNLIGENEYNITEYSKKISKSISEKLGLIAYYDTYKMYKLMINKIKKLDSYVTFITLNNIKYTLKVSYFKYLKVKIKIGIKEFVKRTLTKRRK